MKILGAITVLSLPAMAWSQSETNLQTSAYRNSIAQDEVRRQSEEVRRQLALLLEDIQQNQINTPEAALARQAAERLGTLTDAEIVPLIQKLRDAGTLAGADQVKGELTEASREQKAVQLRLKGMADEFALQKNQAWIQQHFERLLLRQTANLRQTREVAASGGPAEVLTLAQSEQAALRQEIDLAAETLQKVVEGVGEDQKPRFAGALAVLNQRNVQSLAAAASEQAAAKKLTESLASQAQVRDGLQAVVLAFAANRSTEERLQAVANELKKAAAEQKALAENSKASAAQKAEMSEAQNRLADRLSTLQTETRNLNANAAEDARQAAAAMEAAAKNLQANGKPEELESLQKQAAQKLAEAGAKLDQAAERLAGRPDPANAAQALSELQQLSQQILQAQQNAQAMNPAGNPAPAAQAAEAAKLQQQALPLNDQAAQELGAAAAQMNQGATAEAAQSLAAANAQLQQQMQALAQAAATQQQAQQIANAISQAKAEAAQAQAAMKQTAPGGDLMAAIRKTEDAQKTLQAAAAATANSPIGQSLQQAQQELQKSKMNAAQMKKDAATAANAQAQQQMQAALGALQQAAAGAMAKAMGQPPGKPPGQNPPNSQQSTHSLSAQSAEAPATAGQNFLSNADGDAAIIPPTVTLKPKEREAIALLQKEKAPTEYQGMTGQYLKNLAAGEFPAKPLP